MPFTILKISTQFIVTAVNVIAKSILALMVVAITSEVFVRFFWGGTIVGVDEFCGMLLVCYTFLCMPVSESGGEFMGFDLAKRLLGSRSSMILETVLDLIILSAATIILWQFVRFGMFSFRSGEVSSTLTIPLWLPRMLMVLGMASMCLVILARLVARWRPARLLTPSGVSLP